MAPEQFNGSHLDEKVDVYALGCILNECLTGRQPWSSSPNFFQVRTSSLGTCSCLLQSLLISMDLSFHRSAGDLHNTAAIRHHFLDPILSRLHYGHLLA